MKQLKWVMCGLVLFMLAGCSSTNSTDDTNTESYEELTLRIKQLGDEISELREENTRLFEKVQAIQNNEIVPVELSDQILYENHLMPFAILVPKESGLNLVVYARAGSLSINVSVNNEIHFIQGYELISKLQITETPVEHGYSPNDIVKTLNDQWVVVQNGRIENSLDEVTNQMVEAFLKEIEIY